MEDIDEIKVHNDRYLEDTDSALKDRIYNWLVNKHTEKRKKLSFSDRFVWKGAVYTLPELIGYVVFFAMFYYLGALILRKYGVERLFMFFMLLHLWRVQTAIGYLNKLNKKL